MANCAEFLREREKYLERRNKITKIKNFNKHFDNP